MGVTLRRNSKPLQKDSHYIFDSQTGFFGVHVGDARYWMRTIYVTDPAEEAKKMFDILAKGAIISQKANGNVQHAVLDDGTTIDLRIYFPPGHEPSVQINVKKSADPAGVTFQRVHFIKHK